MGRGKGKRARDLLLGNQNLISRNKGSFWPLGNTSKKIKTETIFSAAVIKQQLGINTRLDFLKFSTTLGPEDLIILEALEAGPADITNLAENTGWSEERLYRCLHNIGGDHLAYNGLTKEYKLITDLNKEFDSFEIGMTRRDTPKLKLKLSYQGELMVSFLRSNKNPAAQNRASSFLDVLEVMNMDDKQDHIRFMRSWAQPGNPQMYFFALNNKTLPEGSFVLIASEKRLNESECESIANDPEDNRYVALVTPDERVDFIVALTTFQDKVMFLDGPKKLYREIAKESSE